MKTSEYRFLKQNSIPAVGVVILALLCFGVMPLITRAQNVTTDDINGSPTDNPGSASSSAPETTVAATPTPAPTPVPGFETEILVGIVDVTAGQVEPATGEEFLGQLYVDGRAAFYLKGKIKGKYLLTAQIDTGEEPLNQIFNRLDVQESVFQKIDPEKYYPVYGDDSTMVRDVESLGKIYVRLEWDQSKVLLGNYQVAMNETALVKYNRNLYGLDAELRTEKDVKNQTGTQIFLAKPWSVHSRDIIKATGGALYYLKHANLVMGSEQMAVEIRDTVSGAVLQTIQLIGDKDYDLDYAQGRLILKRSLEAIMASGLITTNKPVDGNALFLIIDYEFEGGTVADNPSYGLRTSYLLGNSLKLGGSLVRETTDAGQSYNLMGVDFQYQLSPNLKVSGEHALSQQSIANRFYSEDGGLTYGILNDTTTGDYHKAWRIGMDLSLPWAFNLLEQFNLQTYTVMREQGFSTIECQTANDHREYGLQLTGKFSGDYRLLFKYNFTDETGALSFTDTTAQVAKDFNHFKLTGELRYQNSENLVESSNFMNVLGAVRMDYPLNETATLYGSQQFTISHNDRTPENNRTTAGVEWKINEPATLNLEASKGSLGDSALLGLKYQWDNFHQTYGKLQYETDTESGYTMTHIVGDKGKLGQNLESFAERRTANGTYENSVANVFGLEYSLGKQWLFSADYTLGMAEILAARPENINPFTGNVTPVSTGPVDRQIFGVGAVYRKDGFEYRSGAQVRYDLTATANTCQFLLANSLKHKLSDALIYTGRLNYSLTRDQMTGGELAHFVEGSMGMAYRPTDNDKFNLITKYDYRQELSPVGQLAGSLPEECYHVLSVEGIVDLSARWQLDEKIAYKRSAIQIGPVLHDWQFNDLLLIINRINYHLPFHWEGCLEYRIMRDIQAFDQKNGFLLAVYYLFENKAKLGIGYNFTSFNDDLIHFNENSRGWFINVVMAW
jgi:hypothetical protein